METIPMKNNSSSSSSTISAQLLSYPGLDHIMSNHSLQLQFDTKMGITEYFRKTSFHNFDNPMIGSEVIWLVLGKTVPWCGR